MKRRVCSTYVLFFMMMISISVVVGTSNEVCDECERERLSLASQWRSFPIDMDVEGFDYHGPSTIHTMLGKAQERIRNLKNGAQKEIEGVKESVEKQLKNIEKDVDSTTDMITQNAEAAIKSSLHDAQKKSDNAKLHSFSTMIQIKYNAHQQALELMKEAEENVVRTIYHLPDDKNRVDSSKKDRFCDKTEDKSDYVVRFNEYISYIERVIEDGEPIESSRNEMRALCEKQKKSFEECFEKNNNTVSDTLLSRYELFERLCQSHRAAVAPLDEQARKKVLSQDHVKKMKLILLYDIQQTLHVPSSVLLQAPDVVSTQSAPVAASRLENRLINELNKRLARVEQHLDEQRKKTKEYAAKLAHAKGTLRKVDKIHEDFERLQQKYLTDMELKEREKREMHGALKRLEDSLMQRQSKPETAPQDELNGLFTQERDRWSSVIESIKQEKLSYEVESATTLSEKENLIRNVAELTTRVITLQNDLITQQKAYEEALKKAESSFKAKIKYVDQPSTAEKERIRENEVRAGLAQAQLRERMSLTPSS